MSRKSHPRPQRLRIDRALIASGIRARCSAPSAHPAHGFRLVRSPPAAPAPNPPLVLLNGLPGGFHTQSSERIEHGRFYRRGNAGAARRDARARPEMERIGWDRPLGQLTQNDMHRLIVITVEAFRAEMAEIAARSRRSRSDAGFQPTPLHGRADQRAGRRSPHRRTRGHAAPDLSRRVPPGACLRTRAAVRVCRCAEG